MKLTSTVSLLTFVAGALSIAVAQQRELLALCGRCASPTVFNKTGTGTANSVAEAKMTPEAFRNSCAEQGFKGAALTKCIKDETAADGGRIYRASANCLAGTMIPIDGKQYAFAGVWPNDDIGGGRTRWRNVATRQIIGRDNASDGLSLSQQWEVLCPGPLRISQQPSMPGRPAPSGVNAAAPAVPVAPAPPPVCPGLQNCTEVNPFAATITDFRFSIAGGYRIDTANIRFQNKLARPIILGYLSGSGLALDDRGNRYGVNDNTGLRGIGLIRGSEMDPKFMLAPGQTADARFEFAWYPRGNEIFGTQYELELTAREIVPVSASQYRYGAEFPLKWRGLGRAETTTAAPAPAAPAAASEPVAPAPVQPAVNHCQGIPNCYSAGPFTAQIRQLTPSIAGGYHVLSFNVRFRNVTNQPLVLAYKNGTSIAIDNHGNRYGQTRANFARGIGVSSPGSANADFVLQPGQTRDASFEVQRYVGRTQMGTGYTWDFAVDQLEILPANQLRTVREYSLNFPDLAGANAPAAPAGNVNNSVQQLKDIFKPKKK